MPEIKRRSGRRIRLAGGCYQIGHAFQEDSELLEKRALNRRKIERSNHLEEGCNLQLGNVSIARSQFKAIRSYLRKLAASQSFLLFCHRWHLH
jgi:hypothetical protein